MKELLDKYEHKRAEIVFEWKDPYSTAEGWVVIAGSVLTVKSAELEVAGGEQVPVTMARY